MRQITASKVQVNQSNPNSIISNISLGLSASLPVISWTQAPLVVKRSTPESIEISVQYIAKCLLLTFSMLDFATATGFSIEKNKEYLAST